MKISPAALLIVCSVCSAHAFAQQSVSSIGDRDIPSTSSLAEDETPAQQRIDAARRQIAADPKKVQAFNDLATAFIRRARETDDTKYLVDAESALTNGLALDPNDFQLQKTQVALMLARGEFAKAKTRATELNRRTLDDVMVYGYLAEAEFGLGDYEGAAKNAQWMMNMLPNNVPALMIGARLRAHFGDPNGAIEFLNLAYTETSPAEVEELAWIANQIASIEIDAGKFDAAMEILDHAEQTFPNYPYTLKNRARAKQARAGAADEKTNSSSEPTPAHDTAAVSVESHAADGPAANMTTVNSGAIEPAHTNAEVDFVPVPSDLLTPRPSDSDRMIQKAQAMAAGHPNDAKAFAALGAAYLQRARETGDVSNYEMAEKSLTKSLDLDSVDFAAEAAFESLAEVCMGEHRFADALNYAQRALALGSGDLSPFAIAGDAYADMGEYAKARDAYERLTLPDHQPSPREAYARDSRLAYLSFVEGETGAAIQLMTAAVVEGSQTEIPQENRAWLYFELGEFETQAGDAQAADAAYRSALKIHPGDYRALAGLARLRANHGRVDEAVTLYQRAIAVVPMPIFVAELGDLFERSGRHEEAKKEFALVEYIGVLGHINQVLHNRDLALFYADHDLKPGEALELARKEFEVRHDIYTWDALAWALYKNGKFAEADKASEEALKYGTRDAVLLFHAGMIADRLGQKDRARSELKAALAINPRFHLLYADAAQRTIARLDAGSQPQESVVGNAR
jgi:tetratricopeptide (TPR) repeat protein